MKQLGASSDVIFLRQLQNSLQKAGIEPAS
jgi:hypothetical protein